MAQQEWARIDPQQAQHQQQPGKKPLARLLDVVVNHSGVVTVLLVAYGVLGFALLPTMERRVKFDENALLAGSARPTLSVLSPDALARGMEFAQAADAVYQTPAYGSWLQSNLQLLGLESFNHSFSADWPYGRRHAMHCTNVHAILRAPRGDGKEAILLVTPIVLQPMQRDLQQTRTAAGLALALGSALMLHLQRVVWLAKDVIWVIPDASCGLVDSMTAWVEAYQSGGGSGTHHDLSYFGRGGVMQQAVVLEVDAVPFDTVELALDGHDGQLPKLDMYWLLKYYATNWLRAPVFLQGQHALMQLVEQSVPLRARSYMHKLAALGLFAWRQAKGLPTGAHAAFKACGVDAATMRLTKQGVAGAELLDARAALRQLGDLLELTVRSCSVLIEKFHHSFFLYLQTGTEGFVTIEQYITPLAAMILSLLLQAAAVKRIADSALGPAPALPALAQSRAAWLASARLVLCAHVLCATLGYGLRQLMESAHLSTQSVASLAADVLRSPREHSHGLGLVAGGLLLVVVLLGEIASMPMTGLGMASSGAGKQQQQQQQQQAGNGADAGTDGVGSSTAVTAKASALRSDWRKVKVLMLSGTAAVLSAAACVNWALAYGICLLVMPLTACCGRQGNKHASFTSQPFEASQSSEKQQQQGQKPREPQRRQAQPCTWLQSQFSGFVLAIVCSPPAVMILLYLLSGHSLWQLFSLQELRWLVLESRTTTYMMFWAVYVPFWLLSTHIVLS